MNRTQRTISAAALAVTMTIGGASVALAGNGDDTPTPDRQARIAAICDDPDAAIATITQHATRLGERISTLEERRTTAAAEGRTKLVERLDKRVARLQQVLDRVNARLAAAPTWIAEHCS